MARGVGGDHLSHVAGTLRVRADYLPIPSATLTIASKSNLGIAKRAWIKLDEVNATPQAPSAVRRNLPNASYMPTALDEVAEKNEI